MAAIRVGALRRVIFPGRAVCSAESLLAPKLPSGASTGRKLAAKCRHPSSASCSASPRLKVNRAKQPTFAQLSAPQLVPASSTVRPVEDLEEIRAELIALLQVQIKALERDTFVGLTDTERYQYDARHNRIQELHAKLGQFKTAA